MMGCFFNLLLASINPRCGIRGGEAGENLPENVDTLQEILVKGTKIITPTKQSFKTVYAGVEVTEKGIEIQSDKAKTNVYQEVSIASGVSFERPDPYNIYSEMAM